ncbi:hypothetical protein FNBNMHLP_00479 [Aeromonas jandaei]
MVSTMRLNNTLLFVAIFTTSATMASPVEYVCEETIFTNGVKAETWPVILDVTLSPKTFSYISFDGGRKKITGFKNNPMAVNFFNKTITDKNSAPAIASFQKEIGNYDFATIKVYGVTGGVKAGDVIQIFWPDWEPYYCYRKGSDKDKVMEKIRNDFNSRL